MTKKKTPFFQERAHKKQENITKKILIVTKMRLRECVDQNFFYKKFLFVAGHRGTTTKSFFHIMMTFDDDRYEKLQNQLIQCDYEYNNSSR